MNAPSQITQLLKRGGELVASLREQLFGLGAGSQAAREQPQPHRERDEPLLGAVVEVALQPPAFTVGGGHEPRAGLVQSPFRALLECAAGSREIAIALATPVQRTRRWRGRWQRRSEPATKEPGSRGVTSQVRVVTINALNSGVRSGSGQAAMAGPSTARFRVITT
jgi:hypothetical protein